MLASFPAIETTSTRPVPGASLKVRAVKILPPSSYTRTLTVSPSPILPGISTEKVAVVPAAIPIAKSRSWISSGRTSPISMSVSPKKANGLGLIGDPRALLRYLATDSTESERRSSRTAVQRIMRAGTQTKLD